MDGSPLRTNPEGLGAGTPAAGLRDPDDNGTAAELDLERLVWDPEYRRTMRHRIKRGS
ncbi:hypothetical protein AAFN88_13335 [Pelagibius sp. CAU 1746]|uniref:hypothetical protein n=1 Tax=Pelagibius sp. CAU 1746 TaxID=3140370 RepID=UPI00325B8FAB